MSVTTRHKLKRPLVSDPVTELRSAITQHANTLELLDRVWNVRTYGGAAGDLVGTNVAGATSDTAAIQSTIDAAAAEYVATGAEQTVIIPAGRYYIPSLPGIPANYIAYEGVAFGRYPALVLKDGVHLRGVGNPTLYNPYNSSGDADAGGEAFITLGPAASIARASIWGIIFESNAAPGDAEKNTDCITGSSAERLRINYCEFRNLRGEAISLVGDGNTVRTWGVHGCDVHDICGQFILTLTGNTGLIEDFNWTGNTGRDNLTVAESILAFGNLKNGLLDGNHFDGLGTMSLADTGSLENIIVENHVHTQQAGAQGSVISLGGGSNVTIRDSVLDASPASSGSGGTAGSHVISALQAAIDGLTIDNVTQIGGAGLPLILQISSGAFDNVTVRGGSITTTEAMAEPYAASIKETTKVTFDNVAVGGIAGQSGLAFSSATERATVIGGTVEGGRIDSDAYLTLHGATVITSGDAPVRMYNGGNVVGGYFEFAATFPGGGIQVAGTEPTVLSAPTLVNTNTADSIYFVDCDAAADYVFVLDPITIGTPGGGDGDGINLVGANSVKRAL